MVRIAMLLALFLVSPVAARAGDGMHATMYKTPYCGCCEAYADHLRENGYDVNVIDTRDLAAIKKRYGVPQEFEGCHTTLVGGYVVEGHVPAKIIDRLLKQRPAIKGISLPGMPEGSPGMTGTKKEPFVIYELSDKSGKVFATD